MEVAAINQLDFDIRFAECPNTGHACETASDHNDLGFGRMMHDDRLTRVFDWFNPRIFNWYDCTLICQQKTNE